METPNMVDVLIQNIATDQELLKLADQKIADAKQEKADVADRIKGYRKEAEVFLKYANPEQKKQIEALGFDSSEAKSSLNEVATKALNIIMEAKGHSLTNDEFYTIYAGSHANPKEVVNYTTFNIKCRPLFNSQRLLRKKADEGISSREDIISLNGTLVKKEEPKDGVEGVKNTSDTKNDGKETEKKETLKDKKDDTTAKKK